MVREADYETWTEEHFPTEKARYQWGDFLESFGEEEERLFLVERSGKQEETEE